MGWLVVLLAWCRGLGCKDHSFLGSAGSSFVVGRSFDAEAQEHLAAAEVRLGSVIEDILFVDAGLGDGAQAFYFALDCGNVFDAQFDFDFGVGLFALGHRDSIGRLLPKLMGCQHNLFVPRAIGR